MPKTKVKKSHPSTGLLQKKQSAIRQGREQNDLSLVYTLILFCTHVHRYEYNAQSTQLQRAYIFAHILAFSHTTHIPPSRCAHTHEKARACECKYASARYI